MAAAEVTVSSGDLMAVKEEEGESSGNNHKTQVILHLQPILHGVNDDSTSTGTTLLAIEAHHDDSKAEGEEVEYGYPITCGDSRAVLLFKKFVCPGINVRCVKFNEQLISPKQFVHLAGKATLKDWKRAIRLGGVMLRKMMDSGQIDFYQHDTVCSNTCRSTKFDVLIHGSRLPPGAPLQPSPSGLALDGPGGQVPLLTDIVPDAEVEEDLGERFCGEAAAAAEWSPGPAQLLNPATANGHAAKRRRADTPDGVLGLWKGVADSGLMGEVLSSLQTELLTTLKGVELRSEKANLQETDAVILNSLCKMFGLLDSVKQALDLRRSHTDQNKLHESAYELDEIMEERRKHGGNKSSSTKVLRRQRHNHQNNQTHNVLSPVKTAIQPLSASYGQLFGYLPAAAGQHHPPPTGMDRDRSKEEEEGMETPPPGHQDISGINKESGLRTGRCREDLHLRSQEEEGTEGLDKAEKMITGRKSLKKHKSK